MTVLHVYIYTIYTYNILISPIANSLARFLRFDQQNMPSNARVILVLWPTRITRKVGDLNAKRSTLRFLWPRCHSVNVCKLRSLRSRNWSSSSRNRIMGKSNPHS